MLTAHPSHRSSRLTAWLARWGDVMPLLVAEFVVWLGFGGLLPVLPLYFTQQGVDLSTLGVVVAAWPAARLISEPVFGWLADRTARVPLMVIGLLVTGLFGLLPLVLTGPLAFVILRAGAGLGAAIYDPAARGYLTDATPPDRRGEAFGLYGSAQMGGLLLGPAIGAVGADALGGIGFVFVFSAVTAAIAAAAVAVRVREPAARHRAGPAVAREQAAAVRPEAPTRLFNRALVAALVINLAASFASGTYEVVWSLFLQGLGGSLTLIGLTFAMFGLPVLVLSPITGRMVDRRGSFAFVVIGGLLPAVAGVLYTFLVDPWLAVPLILIEATGFAFLTPALYSVVAANSPVERSSTTQGLFGASGTLGFIVASLVAGVLAERSILYPFYVFSTVMICGLVLGLLIGGSRLGFRSGQRGPAPAGDSASVA